MCYEGELQCRNDNMKDRIYALKIVPARMNHKKMEDKVMLVSSQIRGLADDGLSSGQSFRYTRSCTIRTSWSSTELLHSKKVHMLSSSFVAADPLWNWSRSEDV